MKHPVYHKSLRKNLATGDVLAGSLDGKLGSWLDGGPGIATTRFESERMGEPLIDEGGMAR